MKMLQKERREVKIKMNVSLITPIYDIESHLPYFIDNLNVLTRQLAKSKDKGILKEIILINNNPKKDIKNFLSKSKLLPLIRLIQNKKNVGYGSACNHGLKIAEGTYFLILNPDVKMHAASLKGLIKFLIMNKDAKIISCKLLNEDGSLQYSCKRFPTLRSLLARRVPFPFKYTFKKQLHSFNMEDYNHKKPKKVDWVSGALMLMRDKYYFDERYFMYFEDVDLCRRVGGVYYYPHVSAVHKAERGSVKNPKLFFLHLKGMLYYFWKFFKDEDIDTCLR